MKVPKIFVWCRVCATDRSCTLVLHTEKWQDNAMGIIPAELPIQS